MSDSSGNEPWRELLQAWLRACSDAEAATARREFDVMRQTLSQAKRDFRQLRRCLTSGLPAEQAGELRAALLGARPDWERLTAALQLWHEDMRGQLTCRERGNQIGRRYAPGVTREGSTVRMVNRD